MTRRELSRFAILAAVSLMMVYGCTCCAWLGVALLGLRGWGNFFSLGQLCLDAAGLVIVVAGFLVAAWEFRRALELPALSLHWIDADSPQGIGKAITWTTPSKSHAKLQAVQIALLNRKAPEAKWYHVEFEIPLELCDTKGGIELRTVVGHSHAESATSDAVWYQAKIPGKGFLCTFISSGGIAALPSNPVILAEIRTYLYKDRQYRREYQVPCRIQVAGEEKPRDDSLAIVVVKED